jgi:hypothetical protein
MAGFGFFLFLLVVFGFVLCCFSPLLAPVGAAMYYRKRQLSKASAASAPAPAAQEHKPHPIQVSGSFA